MSLEANQFDPYLICFKEGKGGFPPTQASLPWLQALRSLCAVCPALASRKGRFPPSVEGTYPTPNSCGSPCIELDLAESTFKCASPQPA